MHEWIEKLVALQELDIRLSKLEEQFNGIPEKRKEAEKQYAAESQALAAATADCKAAETAIRGIEGEIESIRTKKRDFQSKTALIKNNDEYRTALLQIEMCDKAIADAEDRQLAAMEKLEALVAVKKQCEEALAKGKMRAETILEELKLRGQNCTAQIEKLRGERPALREAMKAIDEEALRRYELLRAGRYPKTVPSVVPVVDDSCGRCRMQVTPQTVSDTMGGRMTVCSNCGAILYKE
jgi:predicted  nucleic acid-binding Zn-ribbon protein